MRERCDARCQTLVDREFYLANGPGIRTTLGTRRSVAPGAKLALDMKDVIAIKTRLNEMRPSPIPAFYYCDTSVDYINDEGMVYFNINIHEFFY